MTPLPEPTLHPDALLATWSGAIRRWCLVGMGDPAAADDAAQDAAMRMLRSLERYDPSRPFEPWLRRLVRNVCIDHHRRRQRRTVVPLHEVPRERDDEQRLDLARAARLAEDAFAELTERQREILLAVDVDGHSASDVAQRLDLASGTVRNLLFRGRRKVRAAMLSADPTIAELLEGL